MKIGPPIWIAADFESTNIPVDDIIKLIQMQPIRVTLAPPIKTVCEQTKCNRL